MEHTKFENEYLSFINDDLDKKFSNKLPKGKSMFIIFYTNNIPVSTIKEDFMKYLEDLLINKKEFPINSKIKGVSFKIKYEEQKLINQQIFGTIANI